MRRENMDKYVPMDSGLGLPLHAQGKLYSVYVTLKLSGITPACAGKTSKSNCKFR